MAREVLADGHHPAITAAERHRLIQPRMGTIVDQVLAVAHDVSRDWVRVQVWLPLELTQQVLEMEAQARVRTKS
jgi:hypothetical protein